MQKWEYLRIHIEFITKINRVTENGVETYERSATDKKTDFNIHDYFRRLGIDGWELKVRH